ncbi:hypothetical protein PSACC_00388 [Paramicrosporidium saccamoebae]|uniref:Homeobox domain-containing protein n=1 Tax=Paramicrosporidium saccamoebae TaxID=1246581 RepID=A0A2H9TQ12_9FUNG|nr:hypothetical protein PSACC_00388 [Paramicrosporidium saccamoebae]
MPEGIRDTDTHRMSRGRLKEEGDEHSHSHPQGGMEMNPYGWSTGWPEHLASNELLHAASISPNMLRPGALGLRSNTLSVSPFATQLQHINPDEPLNPNQVKFVNATVEILQSQIRKEEAPKKKRTRTTPEQLRILQKAFSADSMPNSSARLTLAKKLGMNARAVQVWFQNRRAKEKLEAKRAEVGQVRDRGGSLQNMTMKDPMNYVRASLPTHTRLPQRHEGGDEESHPLYDLGMYFGDHSLAQYTSGFELSPYGYTMEGLPQQQLFDDLEEASDVSTNESGESASRQQYTRFQSMPAVAFSYDGMGTSLGLVFDNPHNENGAEGDSKVGERTNSVDALAMAGDVESQVKIFSTPAAGEAFLSAPLGQGIPMPVKQRSLSVPEISSSYTSRGPVEIPPLFRNHELLVIKEEDAPAAEAPQVAKRLSNVEVPPSSLLGTFSGMANIMALDDIQAYLDGMSNEL